MPASDAAAITKAGNSAARRLLIEIVLIENNVVVHTDHGMIWFGGRSDEVRK